MSHNKRTSKYKEVCEIHRCKKRPIERVKDGRTIYWVYECPKCKIEGQEDDKNGKM